MPDRSADWLSQAEHDLDHARTARAAAHHEWACFAAHQAAEKAVKALHYRRLVEARGHSVRALLEALDPAPSADLVERARTLDSFYIPTRYPNGHASGAPHVNYGERQSRQAIEDAEAVVEYARHALAGP